MEMVEAVGSEAVLAGDRLDDERVAGEVPGHGLVVVISVMSVILVELEVVIELKEVVMVEQVGRKRKEDERGRRM
jgi:hypothetical protein